jgi:hypothetical protein
MVLTGQIHGASKKSPALECVVAAGGFDPKPVASA